MRYVALALACIIFGIVFGRLWQVLNDRQGYELKLKKFMTIKDIKVAINKAQERLPELCGELQEDYPTEQYYVCPECKSYICCVQDAKVLEDHHHCYCPSCGQRLSYADLPQIKVNNFIEDITDELVSDAEGGTPDD